MPRCTRCQKSYSLGVTRCPDDGTLLGEDTHIDASTALVSAPTLASTGGAGGGTSSSGASGEPARVTNNAAHLSPDLTPPMVDRPAARPGRTKKVAGLVTAGLGAVAVATGVWFGLEAMDADKEVTALLEMPGIVDWTEDLEAAEARGARDEKLAIGFMAAGGVAIVGGGVLYWLGWREARAGAAPAPAPVTLIPSHGGASVAWSCSF